MYVTLKTLLERRMKAIVAVHETSGGWLIGKGMTIPWSYPDDQAFFKQLTIGQTVIMGHTTFNSLPRPLTNRNTVVIRGSLLRPERDFYSDRGAVVLKLGLNTSTCIYSQLMTTIFKFGLTRNFYESNAPVSDYWLAGGAQTYRLFLPFCSELYVTKVPETRLISSHMNNNESSIYFPTDVLSTYRFDSLVKTSFPELKVEKWVNGK